MSAAETIFPREPALPTKPVADVIQTIETVGVEVLDDSPAQPADPLKTPANRNDVIPFASTLRRVGPTARTGRHPP